MDFTDFLLRFYKFVGTALSDQIFCNSGPQLSRKRKYFMVLRKISCVKVTKYRKCSQDP